MQNDKAANTGPQPFVRPGYYMNECETAYLIHGFEKTGTGGNCTAFARVIAGGDTLLVTVPDDAMAPTSEHDAVIVGRYGVEHSEALEEFSAANLAAVIEGCRARGWL